MCSNVLFFKDMTKLPAKRLNSILSQIRGKRIVVVGDFMLDVYLWGTVDRISPEAPVPVVNVQKTTRLPGGAANVIKNLSELGVEAIPAGVVGDDMNGRILQDLLAKMCPDISGLIVDRSRPTSTKTRIMAHHQQVVRADEESEMEINGDVARKLHANLLSLVKSADAVIYEDYNKGVITAGTAGFIGRFRRNGAFVSVDPKLKNFHLFKGASLIKPNKKEATQMMGRPLASEKDVSLAASRMLKTYGLNAVVITLGEKGMALHEKSGDHTHFPSMARQVFDVTGAGDTVISCITACAAAGATLKEAVYLANQAAGIVVGEVGAASVTVEQIKEAATAKKEGCE